MWAQHVTAAGGSSVTAFSAAAIAAGPSSAAAVAARGVDAFAGVNVGNASARIVRAGNTGSSSIVSGPAAVAAMAAVAGASAASAANVSTAGGLSFAGYKTPPWILASDLDGTMFDPKLPGPTPETSAALRLLEDHLASVGVPLVYITGRDVSLVEEVIAKYGLPYPALLAADVGSTIYMRGNGFWQKSEEWAAHLRETWKPEFTPALDEIIMQLDEARLQPASRQGEFKRSYWAAHHYDDVEVQRTLGAQVKAIAGEAIQAVVSKGPEGLLIDLLPKNGAKDDAGVFIAQMLGLPMERVFFSGDSGNDRGMLLKPGVMAAYVGDPTKPFAKVLRIIYASSNVYVAGQRNIFGVIEALRHYGLMPAAMGSGRENVTSGEGAGTPAV